MTLHDKPGEKARGRAIRALEQLSVKRQKQLNRVLYWRFALNAALLCCDVAMFLVGGTTVLLAQRHMELAGVPGYDGFFSPTAYLLLGGLVWAMALRRCGLYHRHVLGDGFEIAPIVIKAAVGGWVLLCAINFVFSVYVPLESVTWMALVGCVLTLAERSVVRAFVTRDRHNGNFQYSVVLVGSVQGMSRTLQFLRGKKQLSYKPVALCPIVLDEASGNVRQAALGEQDLQLLREAWPERELPVLEYSHRLAERTVDLQAQTVMVSDVLRRDSDAFAAFSIGLESVGLEIALMTSAADVAGHQLSVRNIQGSSILTISLAQYGVTTSVVKRVLDFIGSLVLIALSSPIMVATAVAIKLDDGGAVFYRQQRVGRRGEPFSMIKFRSMRVDADALKAQLAKEYGQEGRFIFKLKDDPRVTRVGKFIRRWSIDELPQFFNVLQGQMSLVGPRPPLPEEVAQYGVVYSTRLLVKPGITGPWQVSGRSDLSEEESQQLDVAYVQNWSILGDLVLIFRTVGAVLKHTGAY